MALVGNTFYQTSALDPGYGYAMYYWNQTDTGLIYIRNAADTAWVLVGNASQVYLGNLNTQGGVMNGAISGAHGLSPADTNNFSGALMQGGVNVALKTYVDAQIASVNAAVGTSVASALASVTTLNVSARVARDRGAWSTSGAISTGNTIPLPAYSDGVKATEAECVWGAYVQKFAHGEFTTNTTHVDVIETSNRVYTIDCYYAGGPTYFDVTVGWFIIGFRSS